LLLHHIACLMVAGVIHACRTDFYMQHNHQSQNLLLNLFLTLLLIT